MTPRQWQILARYAWLGDMQAVADELGIKISTVKNQLHTAYAVTGTHGAIETFRVLGWLKPPERDEF